jgi:hypothetical protein
MGILCAVVFFFFFFLSLIFLLVFFLPAPTTIDIYGPTHTHGERKGRTSKLSF